MTGRNPSANGIISGKDSRTNGTISGRGEIEQFWNKMGSFAERSHSSEKI